MVIGLNNFGQYYKLVPGAHTVILVSIVVLVLLLVLKLEPSVQVYLSDRFSGAASSQLGVSKEVKPSVFTSFLHFAICLKMGSTFPKRHSKNKDTKLTGVIQFHWNSYPHICSYNCNDLKNLKPKHFMKLQLS